MDNSPEMVKVMNEKIKKTKAGNLKVVNFDLEHSHYDGEKFDFIFTQMVLHHVNDIEGIINRFKSILNQGGYLAIADLYEEDGSFHGEGFTGHMGFNPESLSGILKRNQFKNISHKLCFVIDRKITVAESKKFEVFLMVAERI